jgi:hypothetical protein
MSIAGSLTAQAAAVWRHPATVCGGMKRVFVIWVFAALWVATPAFAANIYATNFWGWHLIHIDGELNRGMKKSWLPSIFTTQTTRLWRLPGRAAQ